MIVTLPSLDAVENGRAQFQLLKVVAPHPKGKVVQLAVTLFLFLIYFKNNFFKFYLYLFLIYL
jgi:hypothetical protein